MTWDEVPRQEDRVAGGGGIEYLVPDSRSIITRRRGHGEERRRSAESIRFQWDFADGRTRHLVRLPQRLGAILEPEDGRPSPGHEPSRSLRRCGAPGGFEQHQNRPSPSSRGTRKAYPVQRWRGLLSDLPEERDFTDPPQWRASRDARSRQGRRGGPCRYRPVEEAEWNPRSRDHHIKGQLADLVQTRWD
jgi:hypothetical protein